ncbi:MAG: hypothetical protein ACFFA6_07985 [Promethearchaeota archaeon]
MVNIRICPNCKKPKLKNAVNVSGWLGADFFECTNCGYTGRFYIEVDSEDFELDQGENSNNQ